MSKHTPGPWGERSRDEVAATIRGPSGQLLCDVNLIHFAGLDNANANVRLIAAAPELLSALISAQHRLCEHCPQYIDSSGEQVGDHTDECLAALDAIDKAEGRS